MDRYSVSSNVLAYRAMLEVLLAMVLPVVVVIAVWK